MLNARESAAVQAIDAPAAVDDLLELMAIPSVTGSDAESELLARLAPRLERLDLDVDHWRLDLDTLRADPGFPGTEVDRHESWGLVGTSAGDGPPALILQGHVDVVPPGDRTLWAADPFTPRRTGDTVHGRGACDMKAGVVANLAALTAIRAAGVRLERPVALHLVGGEEDGGLGAFGTLRRGHTGAACIITEPTSGTLVTANGGSLTFTLKVTGLATHGSTRSVGVSAIDAYLPVHHALRDFEQIRNKVRDPLMTEYDIPAALSVGTVRAGDWASSVPDRLEAQGRFGVRLDEDPADARRAFEAVVADACAADPWLRDHPVEVVWSGGRFASGRLPAGHPLAALVASAHADVGGAVLRERGAPWGSDLRLYAAAQIPTLHVGPGRVEDAHSPRDQVRIAELLGVTRTLVLCLLRSAAA